MKYVGLFEGISGFGLAFKRAGFEIAAVCEIDKTCQSVLRRHHPEAEIISDVKTITRETFAGRTIDVLAGGFPCQDLSVAGKRAGLAGERSGLFWEMLRVIEDHSPRIVVIENVPGLLSSNNGQDIQIVIDGLTQIGYTVDVDIKDAQEFGVAQRRRRVFLVCVRLSDSLKRKTNLSRQISADLVVQQLADIWSAIPQAWSAVQLHSDSGSQTERSVNLLRKRMALLNVAREDLASEKYPSGLDALLAQFTDGGLSSESFSTERSALREQSLQVTAICKSLLKKMESDDGHLNMSTLLNNALEGVLKQASKSTTLIFSLETTETTIFTFSLAMLHTVALIAPCLDWSSSCWSVASSVLTLLKESTNYARQASRSLFISDRMRDGWRDYLSAASGFHAVFEQCLGAVRASEILSLLNSSAWDSPPSRESGQGVAGTLAAGAHASGFNGQDAYQSKLVTFGLNGRRADRPNGGLYVNETEQVNTLTNAQQPGTVLASQFGVRRLTPTEWERLQGFPDGHTAFGDDGKPISDSARYRMIGNAICVPTAEWIAGRVVEVLRGER